MSLLEIAEKAVKETAVPDRDGAMDRQEVARAVLMAVREPKGKMISAGAKLSFAHKVDNPADDVLNRLNAMAIYTAMIDAALEE